MAFPFLKPGTTSPRDRAGTVVFRAGAFVAALLLAFVAAMPAQAFRLAPIVQDFAPAGRGAVQNFVVTNTTSDRIAVEVTMVRREIDLDGNETLTPEEEDFVVFPGQMTLDPGKSQTLQVRWIGEPAPETELAYRIVAEQLPIELDRSRQGQASIRLLVKYEGSIYVVPDEAEADIQLEGVRRVVQAGTPGLEVMLSNAGNAHGIVRAPKLSVADSAGTTVELDGEALAAMTNINLLAGDRRRVILSWPSELQAGALTGVLESTIER